MANDVQAYFDEIVLPTITSEYPDLSAAISVIVLGSAGLGIADEFSDLEAAIYLDDALWRAKGGRLQLTLNKLLQATNPYRAEGSVLCVWPWSWLFAGHTQEFLDGADAMLWEAVTIEDLFTVQNNMIVWDPQNRLHALRAAIAPHQMPSFLWKKRLLLSLKKLIEEDFSELRSCVKRGRSAEAHILFGSVLETLFHTAFLIARCYFPWRTHLRWAFEQLSAPATAAIPHVDAALAATDWDEKMRALERVVAIYREYIAGHKILPEIDIHSSDLGEEFVWAERLRAWENPHWKEWIVHCKEQAVSAGYPAHEFWVWSLWGWANEESNQSMGHAKQ